MPISGTKSQLYAATWGGLAGLSYRILKRLVIQIFYILSVFCSPPNDFVVDLKPKCLIDEAFNLKAIIGQLITLIKF